MSLARKAAGSILWATMAGAGSRAITIVSTFVLTRYLAPEVQGEVNLAFVLVATLGAATALGVSQYVAANPKEGPDTTFHGTVLVLGSGVIACLCAVVVGPAVARLLDAPGMVTFIPGIALAHYIERCAWMPRSLLVRDMRFRLLALRVTSSELAFAVSSVAFAMLGKGGHSIVLGALARSVVGLLLLLRATSFRDWLSPCRLSAATFRRLLRFGLPISVASLFRVGATTWDNTFIGYRFGEGALGVYNQAYRLAELPSTAVGDQCNDVLVPTFARASDADARRRGYLRAAALIAFVVAPMALGLSAVSPTIVSVFYPPAYAGVAPFLAVLAPLGLIRTLGSLTGAFLQVVGRTTRFILIDLMLVVLVLGLMSFLARWGAVASAAGVVLAFATSVTVLLHGLRPDQIKLYSVFRAVARPLAASIVMAGAVVALRHALAPLGAPGVLRLLCEVAGGALVYAGASFVISPRIVRDFLEIAGGLVRRGKGAPAPQPT